MGLAEGTRMIAAGIRDLLSAKIAMLCSPETRHADACAEQIPEMILESTAKIKAGDHIVIILAGDAGNDARLVMIRRNFLRRCYEMWQVGTPGPLLGILPLNATQEEAATEIIDWYSEKYQVVLLRYIAARQ